MAPEAVSAFRFSLDQKSGVPFYKQLILQVEMAIADGRLAQGDQLPTVRSLAVELKINPNTVSRAYGHLEVRGIVTTQQGTGTFVGDRKVEHSEIERERVLAELTRNVVAQAGAYGIGIQELLRALQELEPVRAVQQPAQGAVQQPAQGAVQQPAPGEEVG